MLLRLRWEFGRSGYRSQGMIRLALLLVTVLAACHLDHDGPGEGPVYPCGMADAMAETDDGTLVCLYLCPNPLDGVALTRLIPVDAAAIEIWGECAEFAD